MMMLAREFFYYHLKAVLDVDFILDQDNVVWGNLRKLINCLSNTTKNY